MADEPETRTPKQIVAEGYNQVAGAYARLEGDTVWPRTDWLERLLIQLPRGSTVLDLGCGSGDPVALRIAQEHYVIGVDISEAQIDLARRNVPAGQFLQGDLAAVDFPPASLEAVVSFYTLEHLPRAEHAAILQRIAGWLRPGGLLLLSLEAGDYDDELGTWLGVPMFLSCFDPDTTRSLVEAAGLTIVETAIEAQLEQGHPIPYLWVLAQRS
jgi:SAM-dependent methyltransferase